MANLTNIGMAQIANRGFVALAVEAGIVGVIESLVLLAVDKKTLLGQLSDTLSSSNPELADALNTQTLDAIMAYMDTLDTSGVVEAQNLPVLMDEDGPVSVTANWNGGSPSSEQIDVTYWKPPVDYTAEIYLDGVFAKHSTVEPAGDYCFDAISGIQVAITNVRVLYRDGEGNLTRFGPIANV